jgi:hypothetical protein
VRCTIATNHLKNNSAKKIETKIEDSKKRKFCLICSSYQFVNVGDIGINIDSRNILTSNSALKPIRKRSNMTKKIINKSKIKMSLCCKE